MRIGLAAAVLLMLAGAAAAQTPSGQPSERPSLLPPRGIATFAAGTFWYLEADFDSLPGVLRTVSGYVGEVEEAPRFRRVRRGRTGHVMAVQVTYDPIRLPYEQLLDFFWRSHDPLTADAQFCDEGSQYRAVIFFHDEEQERLAKDSREKLEASGRFTKPIVTEILPLAAFHRAEDEHQDYYLRHPVQYRYERWKCGRDRRLKEVWGQDARTG